MSEEKKEVAKGERLQFGKNEEKGFSVRVHVIEARELKGREDGGVSDPVCFVTVNGKKEKTKVMKKTLSCVWDHCFFFDLKMSQPEFDAALVQFDVYDANAIKRNTLIGASTVGLQTVYTYERHEMYKQWVALTDTGGNFEGVQGYLKFSVTVVPDDEEAPAPRNEDEEDDDDDGDIDLQSLVLNAPDINLQEFYIHARVWKAEGIPKMDRSGKADPFVLVKFGGRKHQTQVQKNTLTPVWNEELMLPAALPALTDRIEVSFYDWDRMGANDLIAATYFHFSEIKGKAFGPKWVYFYGAPGGDTSKEAEAYNKGWQEGTAYRGRLLMSMHAESAVKPRINSLFIKPTNEFHEEDYFMTIDVYEGNEIVGTSSTVYVDFSVGSVKIGTAKSKQSKKGSARFYEQLEGKFQLPADINWVLKEADKSHIQDLPDLLIEVFVKGWTGKRQRCGYLRYKLVHLLGWNNEPSWRQLQPDELGFKYSESQMPGNLLLKIGFGRWADEVERPHLRELKLEKFQLRCNMYQARALPAADDNGLCDPYVRIRMAGHEIKLPRQEETVNPTWYETACIEVELPTPLIYAPDVTVFVFDWDKFSGDDLIGRFHYPAIKMTKELPKTPTWFPLYFDDPDELEGEVLASFQLIPLEEAKSMPVVDIHPRTKDCIFEINALGLRGMLPFNLLSVNNPYIEFDTGTKHTRNSTKNEARVRGQDIDILETVHLSVALPLEDVYSPSVNVRVFDKRVTGTALVGSASIPIQHYLPWVVAEREKAKAARRAEEEAKKLAEAQDAAARTGKAVAAGVGGDSEEKKAGGKKKKGKSKRKKKSTKDSKAKLLDDDDDADDVSDDDVAIDIADEEDEQSISADEESSSDEEEEDDDDDEKKEDQPQLDTELEDLLQDDLPFEEFELFRGKSRGLSPLQKLKAKELGGTRIPCGRLKGRFRVIENENLRNVEDAVNLKALYKPKKYVVRAYILEGVGIVPHDDNGFSDPYLLLSTGIESTKKKDGCLQKKTQRPAFFNCFQMKALIPGPPLRIRVMDHDDLGGDDLIGFTEIDLENRFFCPAWKQMKPKPIESRTLRSDVSKASQGELLMFLEVMTQAEADRNPPKNIAPPPPKDFELRVVVWETKDVDPERGDEKRDIYVTGLLEGMPRNEIQQTDCHWNSKDGFGSFNWRMKFPITLPYPNPRLKIQILDKDITSSDDMICEAILNLQKYFKRAFKKDKGFEFTEKWLKCTHPNKPGVHMGEVKLTIELLPKLEADGKPNGHGRKDPNQYPFLMPPDRPESSFNPFNPLSWAKFGSKALMKKAGAVCIPLMIIMVLILLWRVANIF